MGSRPHGDVQPLGTSPWWAQGPSAGVMKLKNTDLTIALYYLGGSLTRESQEEMCWGGRGGAKGWLGGAMSLA